MRDRRFSVNSFSGSNLSAKEGSLKAPGQYPRIMAISKYRAEVGGGGPTCKVKSCDRPYKYLTLQSIPAGRCLHHSTVLEFPAAILLHVASGFVKIVEL
jgi:hypothetical protein